MLYKFIVNAFFIRDFSFFSSFIGLLDMEHTNGIENFWSHLKRGVDGIYHWVSKEHLQSYVTEYALRFNTRKMTTSGRFDLVLSNVAGRLTYKELTK